MKLSIYENLQNENGVDPSNYRGHRGSNEGLAVHCKCIYALDKANQLTMRRGLIEIFDEIFATYFKKLHPMNIVNIGNIFAKNAHTKLGK